MNNIENQCFKKLSENTEGAFINGQSRETRNIGYTKTNKPKT